MKRQGLFTLISRSKASGNTSTGQFKRFRTATITIGGFESMRIIRKRQLEAEGHTSAEIFYSVAA